MLGGAPADADGLVLHLDFNAESGGRVTDRVSGAAIPVLRALDAIDGAIAGRLDGPGDTRSYSFPIAAPTPPAFDALPHRTNARSGKRMDAPGTPAGRPNIKKKT